MKIFNLRHGKLKPERNKFDPTGSYTGVPKEPFFVPEQDADDL